MKTVTRIISGKQSRRLLLYYAFVACTALVLTARVRAADEKGGVSIEWAYLATYPEADCTKIHVYVKNTSKFPVFLEGIHLNDKFLDLDLDRQQAANMVDVFTPGADAVASDADHAAHDDHTIQPSRTQGSLQWHRALPNPVEPHSITDVTVSLWGIVKETALRIPVRGGGELRWDAKEEPRALRLSQICFDPGDPNKIYVYCENKTDKDVTVDHILVDTEEGEISKSIPSGNTIEAGKKSCFIVHPKQKMIWGKYVGVSVLGKGGENVIAVIRVINFFPIGSWSVDTRPEMFFDSVDLRKSMTIVSSKTTLNDTANIGDLLAPPIAGRPYQACYDGYDPTCDTRGWTANASSIIRNMHNLAHTQPFTPYYTHICRPLLPAYALFGELPDLVFVNPYTILFRPAGPMESGRLLKAARAWTDPKPILTIPEAFSERPEDRDITPDEVSFALWNEVAEGAKGVRYFTNHCGSPARGFTDMRGVEAEIVHDNCDLQLLKNWLRIGDVVTLGSTSKRSVECKSLLCGDRGILVVLLNHEFAAKRGTPWEWTPVMGVDVCVTVPHGQEVAQVFQVKQGFAPVLFRKSDDAITFALGKIGVFSVFLLEYAHHGLVAAIHTPENELQRVGSTSGNSCYGLETIRAIYKKYISSVSRLIVPITNPETLYPDEEVVKIGLSADSARERMLKQLQLFEKEISQSTSTTVLPLLSEIEEYYVSIAECAKAEDACDHLSAGLNGLQKGEALASLAALYSERGKYGLSASLYERSLACARSSELRLKALDSLIEVHEKKRHDYDQAITWARAKFQSLAGDPAGLSRAQVELGSLLLMNEKPREAIEELRTSAGDRSQDASRECLLGVAYIDAREYEQARAHLRNALTTLHEGRDRIQYMLAFTFYQQEDYSQAERELLLVARMFPDSKYGAKARALADRLSQPRKDEMPLRK